MKTKVLCTCSKCRLRICIYKEEETHGWLVVARTRNKHIIQDKVREEYDAEQVEEAISSTILLAAGTQPLSRLASGTLPVRRRDSQRDWTEQFGSVAAADSEVSSSHHEDMSEAERHGPAVPVKASPSFVDAAQFAGMVRTRSRVLGDLCSTMDMLCRGVQGEFKLTFPRKPQTLADPAPEPNEGVFISLNTWLLDTWRYVEQDISPLGHHDMDQRRLALVRQLREQILRLEKLKLRAWSKCVVEHLVREQLGQDHGQGPVPHKLDNSRWEYARTAEHFVLAALIMTTVFHSIAATSRDHSQYILATLQAVLFGAFIWCNRQLGPAPDLIPSQADLLRSFPTDIRSTIKMLGLEPNIIRHACCPDCFATYPPNTSRPDDPYPHTCTFQETDKPVCGAALVYRQEHVPAHKGGNVRVTFEPFLAYPYHSVESWIGNMLLRSGVSGMMRNAWRPARGPRWTDIFHAPAVRTFLGPDGKTPFSQQPDAAIHLVFSLFIDWFNPFGNKKGGKSQSVGAIFMICMNLPDDIRYKPENICLVSIIPGPKEPQIHQLNHLLRPLIDELLTLWRRGILYTLEEKSRITRSYFVRAAMIPLVCDIPALRKAAGFAGHMAANFCSFCSLQKKSINNLDRAKWGRLTWEEHLRYAAQWRDAPTEAARKKLFDTHGLRWSELLRLEYWDPTQFAVVDAMHNLFLGEFRHHCREVWGIDVKDKDSDSSKVPPHTPDQQRANLARVYKTLQTRTTSTFNKIRKGYIVAVAEVNGIVPAGGTFVKASYVAALLAWVQSSSDIVINLPPVLEESTSDFHVAAGPHDISKYRVIDQATISAIRDDIAATYFPSWMERPPKNFGSPSHGKLKADQWRTVCTVSLTITLGRLWGSPDALEKHRQLLDNFVSLVCAVDLATRRSMDSARAERFDRYMLQYLQSLRELFNHQLVPNHHMSLHLRECLMLFGPVHGWWAFPFERYNGLLQKLNTNKRSDKMSLTFLRYFYIGSTLRWLVNTTSWPNSSYFRQMMERFKQAIMSTRPASGVQAADFVPFGNDSEEARVVVPAYDEEQEAKLSTSLYHSLLHLVSSAATPFASMYSGTRTSAPVLNDRANLIRNLTRDGIKFATRKAGLRDSFVLFSESSHPGDGEFLRAGQISEIILHGRTVNGNPILEPFVVLDEFRCLDPADIAFDPYRKYADLGTRVFYKSFHETQRVVRLEDLKCHFAALFCSVDGIDQGCVVARSLDRD